MKIILKLSALTILIVAGYLIFFNQPERVDPSDIPAVIAANPMSDWDGNPVSPDDFRGKVVLLDFWETWCPPCMAYMPVLHQLREEFPEQFVVIAATPGYQDTADNVARFRANHPYDFVFTDAKDLARALNLSGIPHKILFDPEGNVVFSETGARSSEREYQRMKEYIDSFL